MRFRALSFALFVVVAPSAFAWDAKGHQIIAEIAYRNLTPAVKQKCDDILSTDPEARYHVFFQASTWADDIKSTTKDFDNWHYINKFIGRPDQAAPKPNVLAAIEAQTKELKSGLERNARRDALKWLLHLIGDVHQPLHTTARYVGDKHDRGGNDFLLGNERGQNLHTFWDRALTNATQGMDIQKSADYALRRAADAPGGQDAIDKAVKDLNANDWVLEGYKIASDFVYSTPEGQQPGAAYTKQAQEIALTRAVIGGRRMAAWLNDTLK